MQRPVFDEVLERIEAIAKSIVIGDPPIPTTHDGPAHLPAAVRQGGRLHRGRAKRRPSSLFGGRHGAELVPDRPGGYWVEPTLFLAEDNSPRICQEEIFGPVGVVIPFDTDDEAIALANDSRYGLASGSGAAT